MTLNPIRDEITQLVKQGKPQPTADKLAQINRIKFDCERHFEQPEETISRMKAEAIWGGKTPANLLEFPADTIEFKEMPGQTFARFLEIQNPFDKPTFNAGMNRMIIAQTDEAGIWKRETDGKILTPIK